MKHARSVLGLSSTGDLLTLPMEDETEVMSKLSRMGSRHLQYLGHVRGGPSARRIIERRRQAALVKGHFASCGGAFAAILEPEKGAVEVWGDPQSSQMASASAA